MLGQYVALCMLKCFQQQVAGNMLLMNEKSFIFVVYNIACTYVAELFNIHWAT